MLRSIDPVSDRPVERTGRRDAAASREAIFAAARRAFAADGYSLTSIRDIAESAGVNSALVGRYFGSKEDLFREVLDRSLDMGPVLQAPREQFGAHVVALFRAARHEPSPLSMMLLSMADPDARRIVVDLIENRIIGSLADYLGGAGARVRAAKLNMLWSGFLTGTQLFGLAELEGDGIDAAENWLARATQAIVDEDG